MFLTVFEGYELKTTRSPGIGRFMTEDTMVPVRKNMANIFLIKIQKYDDLLAAVS